MNTVVWIVTGLLAGLFLVAGTTKLAKSKEQLGADPRMGWSQDLPAGLIKAIGTAEVLGLAVLMAGAVVTHLRRDEGAIAGFNVVLLALAVFVAVERIGPQAF